MATKTITYDSQKAADVANATEAMDEWRAVSAVLNDDGTYIVTFDNSKDVLSADEVRFGELSTKLSDGVTLTTAELSELLKFVMG